MGGGGVEPGRGARADVNKKLKLLWKCKKIYIGVGVSGPAGDVGVEGWGLVDREEVGWQQCWG